MDGNLRNEVDHGGMCYPTETNIYKVFNDTEYADEVNAYYHQSNLYHIKYEDRDLEAFFLNKVCNHQTHTLPSKQQWNYQRKDLLQSLFSKLAPVESGDKEHVMKLEVETISSISELNTELNYSEEEVPNGLF